MRIEVEVPDFRELASSVEGGIATAATEAMRETSPGAAADVREQVVAAGLGARLGNTWRWRVYPDRGYARQSLSPAGLVWSRAPEIMESFLTGAQIVPIGGSRYLAIPTDAVPRAPGASRATSTKRMTPEQVEVAFDQDLIIRPGKDGHLLGFIDPAKARFKRVRRPRGTGKSKLVLMFTFVTSLRMPKLLDLQGPADRWSSAFRADFTRRLA